MAASETRKPSPNRGYVSWLEQRTLDETFIGAPTVGELFAGIARLKASIEREHIATWAQQIVEAFAERILPFDGAAAHVWGEAIGSASCAGRPLAIIDAQLAAIALVNGLTVVTRNVRHFTAPEFVGLRVINPWT